MWGERAVMDGSDSGRPRWFRESHTSGEMPGNCTHAVPMSISWSGCYTVAMEDSAIGGSRVTVTRNFLNYLCNFYKSTIITKFIVKYMFLI